MKLSNIIVFDERARVTEHMIINKKINCWLISFRLYGKLRDVRFYFMQTKCHIDV